MLESNRASQGQHRCLLALLGQLSQRCLLALLGQLYQLSQRCLLLLSPGQEGCSQRMGLPPPFWLLELHLISHCIGPNGKKSLDNLCVNALSDIWTAWEAPQIFNTDHSI